MKYILIIALFLLTSSNLHAQGISNSRNLKYGDVPYILSTPEGYSDKEVYPTIIFLHGGDRSNTKHHPSKYAEKAGIDFPFIVLAPSCTGGCSWSTVDLEGLFRHALREVKIDKSRVYLTGYSMGGAGTWANLKKIHQLLAAASPLAPAGGSTSDLCQVRDLPIRIYHGTADGGYRNSQKMLETLIACGAVEAELVSLEGQGHGIWPGIFSDPSFYNWLLSHSRK